MNDLDIDPYAVLDVPWGADEEEISRAYRTVVRSAHPDGGGTLYRFWEVQEAYEILRDPDRRAEFDGVYEDGPTVGRSKALRGERRRPRRIPDDGGEAPGPFVLQSSPFRRARPALWLSFLWFGLLAAVFFVAEPPPTMWQWFGAGAGAAVAAFALMPRQEQLSSPFLAVAFCVNLPLLLSPHGGALGFGLAVIAAAASRWPQWFWTPESRPDLDRYDTYFRAVRVHGSETLLRVRAPDALGSNLARAAANNQWHVFHSVKTPQRTGLVDHVVVVGNKAFVISRMDTVERFPDAASSLVSRLPFGMTHECWISAPLESGLVDQKMNGHRVVEDRQVLAHIHARSTELKRPTPQLRALGRLHQLVARPR